MKKNKGGKGKYHIIDQRQKNTTSEIWYTQTYVVRTFYINILYRHIVNDIMHGGVVNFDETESRIYGIRETEK